ncbi:hypothetical protein BDF14DRAFT_1767237 [Spinellus fusiger]|nr:hypothetical protein BDF14DRAFT_1767237 [Spinellus fusiger]
MAFMVSTESPPSLSEPTAPTPTSINFYTKALQAQKRKIFFPLPITSQSVRTTKEWYCLPSGRSVTARGIHLPLLFLQSPTPTPTTSPSLTQRKRQPQRTQSAPTPLVSEVVSKPDIGSDSIDEPLVVIATDTPIETHGLVVAMATSTPIETNTPKVASETNAIVAMEAPRVAMPTNIHCNEKTLLCTPAKDTETTETTETTTEPLCSSPHPRSLQGPLDSHPPLTSHGSSTTHPSDALLESTKETANTPSSPPTPNSTLSSYPSYPSHLTDMPATHPPVVDMEMTTNTASKPQPHLTTRRSLLPLHKRTSAIPTTTTPTHRSMFSEMSRLENTKSHEEKHESRAIQPEMVRNTSVLTKGTPSVSTRRPSKLPIRRSLSTPTQPRTVTEDSMKEISPLHLPVSSPPSSPLASSASAAVTAPLTVPSLPVSVRSPPRSPLHTRSSATHRSTREKSQGRIPIRSDRTMDTPLGSLPRPASPSSTLQEADIPMSHTPQHTHPHEQSKKEEKDEAPGPISIKEKRERQAKRAEQIKFWRVREEREAREVRLAVRRRFMAGEEPSKEMNDGRVKKLVKFNLRKNKIMEIACSQSEGSVNETIKR